LYFQIYYKDFINQFDITKKTYFKYDKLDSNIMTG